MFVLSDIVIGANLFVRISFHSLVIRGRANYSLLEVENLGAQTNVNNKNRKHDKKQIRCKTHGFVTDVVSETLVRP